MTADITYTPDQDVAFEKIVSATQRGMFFLLTGDAGTGKTSLMPRLARHFASRRMSAVFTAPTHKAVAVLSKKLRAAGLDNDCVTIHALLSLKPKVHGDRMVFSREKNAAPVNADVVFIDECSMVDSELFGHIRRNLPNAFVIFVGDPAQLPPVNEKESLTFSTKQRAHLSTIVRQADGNPILDAASIIRASQKTEAADWTWCKYAKSSSGHGVFVPRDANEWLRRAFTSKEFDEDPDSFRYLAWTNKRVAEINMMVRRWRYGDNIPTPFMPGERAMFRSPLLVEKQLLFSTNEEATVIAIVAKMLPLSFPSTSQTDSWTDSLPAWEVSLSNDHGESHKVFMPADNAHYQRIITRLKSEAADDRSRWKTLHDLKAAIANLQSIYASTVHTAQGSTHGCTFVDLADIRRRQQSNLLEMQQLLYTAITRPRHHVVIV